MSSPAPLALGLYGISKRFASKLANDDISLELAPGEVLGLLGENGAGKTTLISILFGHYVADAGHIEVFGQRLAAGSPSAAIAAGVGLVHQHFTLAANLSVLDNVMAGTQSIFRPVSSRRLARQKLRALSQQFGLAVEPDAKVARLSVGERQRVEILKSLYRGARILVLDEPTAVLTPIESASLFEALGRMAAEGLSVILISHKLDEVLRVSDRVAILRAGRIVAVRPADSMDRGALAELMVGRRVSRPSRQALTAGEPVLRLEGVASQGAPALSDARLVVHARQIVALVGVAGNGQRAVIDLACGLAVPRAGLLEINGRTVRRAHAAGMHAAQVARIPEDRHEEGVVGDLRLWENAVLEDLDDPRFVRLGWLRQGAARAQTARLIADFDIRCTGPEQRTRLLSGGNMQKLIIGRGLDANPRLIVACQPTRGLDEGAVVDTHSRLLQAREVGAGVLLITEDLDEALGLADSIVVIQDGRISAPLTAPYDLQRIALMMLGEAAHAH
ncbi:ABC transporter ATP-binding protein [Variovorax ginsengisoli]|uniref:Simple sugar transport system ATP-binding protein n=1 Tax=Variovorax ginsengisoli TaxID=363844 RepID=A0ABT9SCA0_9BURK|nr:ABC transporter ATP-binding protein [Variovorax ginsengisoli]MDP9901850.1 simple sugar transport system ATP-binding protein [Variovorax ginsengisoli]